MYIYKVYTAENSLGWASLISTPKENLYGAMVHLLTSISGQKTNQTTFTMRTAFILLDSFKTISMNGTMSTAQTATDSPVRKVRLGHFVPIESLRIKLLRTSRDFPIASLVSTYEVSEFAS